MRQKPVVDDQTVFNGGEAFERRECGRSRRVERAAEVSRGGLVCRMFGVRGFRTRYRPRQRREPWKNERRDESVGLAGTMCNCKVWGYMGRIFRADAASNRGSDRMGINGNGGMGGMGARRREDCRRRGWLVRCVPLREAREGERPFGISTLGLFTLRHSTSFGGGLRGLGGLVGLAGLVGFAG